MEKCGSLFDFLHVLNCGSIMIPTYNISDFPSSKNIDNQIMIETFENLKRPENLQWPHKHNFYAIQWLTAGKASNIIDYHHITIQPDMLFFISPGQLHLMSRTDDIKGYTITFTEEFLLMHTPDKNALFELSFLDNSWSNPFLKLNPENISDIQPIIEILTDELNRKQKSEAVSGHLLFALLNRIQRILTVGETKNQDIGTVVKFKKFRRLVDEYFKTQHTLSFYSDKLHLSTHRINEICKKTSGIPAGEVIRERLLLETKRLLLHSNLNIGEISEELGFSDFSYFSRQFKKSEGVTPAQFRKTQYQKYQNPQ